MRKPFIPLLALIALILMACTTERDQLIASNPEAYATGQQIYHQYCAGCHGVNGEGQFPNAPLQADSTGRLGAPPHNSNGHTWHHADDLLYQIVQQGGMGDPQMFYPMPAFGEQLTNEEIHAVIFYIKTFWTEEQRQRQQQITDASP